MSGRSVPAALRKAWVTRYHESNTQRAQAEAELAEKLGLPFTDVVLYCPALTAMKEAAVPVETSRGLQHLNDAGSGTFAEIGALQDRYADLWRFYIFVPANAVQRTSLIADEMFQVPCELVLKQA